LTKTGAEGRRSHVRRLTFFIKGNVDIHDSLHSCRVGGTLAWNGINDVLRKSHPGRIARIKHETWTRSDALLHSIGTVPEALAGRNLPLGAYPAASQFSRAVLETDADAIVLSIQPDIATPLVRHKTDGFLFFAGESGQWRAEDRRWLKNDFEPLGRLDVAESMANLASIVEKIRSHGEAPILIYNMSPITPGESIHCHQGIGEAFSTRIRRFNLGLIGLSERTGVSIIDVESLLARKGADALKLDTLHLNPPGYRLVAEEVVRVLEEIGLLEGEEA
jgi:lysophospholipase L1-like esterase